MFSDNNSTISRIQLEQQFQYHQNYPCRNSQQQQKEREEIIIELKKSFTHLEDRENINSTRLTLKEWKNELLLEGKTFSFSFLFKIFIKQQYNL